VPIVDELTSTTGIVALAAAATAAVSLVLCLVLALRLRRLRAAQRIVLGDSGAHDLVAHAAGLDREFRELRDGTHATLEGMHARLDEDQRRLDGAIAYRSLVRYDAYNEMSGRQSTSIALLDASHSGVVLSSILHREQARLYAKQVHNGEAELELSPEEAEAVRIALAGEQS
jgi:hypothetical protein